MSEEEVDEVIDQGPEADVDKGGYIEHIRGGKKKGKFVYCTLSGSSIYVYGDKAAATAKRVLEVQNTEVLLPSDKRFTIDVKKDGKLLFSLAATSKEEAESWFASLSAAVNKPPGSAPQKEKKKKAKVGIGIRVVKTGTGMVATSGIGKTAVRGVVNEETRCLLIALKKIIAKVENPKVAEEMEDNMIKIITKSFFLEKDKKITIANFLLADAPLREAFEALIAMRDYSHRMKAATINDKLRQVHDYLMTVERILHDMLEPHLKPNSLKRLGRIFGLLGSEEFLRRAWADDDLEEERDLLTDAMNRYTQFHFN